MSRDHWFGKKQELLKRNGKYVARVIGWYTPRTKNRMGLVVPGIYERITSKNQIPKSAIKIFVVLFGKNGEPVVNKHITRKELKNYYLVS